MEWGSIRKGGHNSIAKQQCPVQPRLVTFGMWISGSAPLLDLLGMSAEEFKRIDQSLPSGTRRSSNPSSYLVRTNLKPGNNGGKCSAVGSS